MQTLGGSEALRIIAWRLANQGIAYDKDLCLIQDNFWGYRNKTSDSTIEPMKDRLAAYRGRKLVWQVDFPPDAELIVGGKKIFALTRTKTKVYLKEVSPPKS